MMNGQSMVVGIKVLLCDDDLHLRDGDTGSSNNHGISLNELQESRGVDGVDQTHLDLELSVGVSRGVDVSWSSFSSR